MKIKNPFYKFLLYIFFAIGLLLWVILPDFLPFLIDDIIAFIGAITSLGYALNEMKNVWRM